MRLIDADALYENVTEKYSDIVAGRYPFNIVAYDMANMVKDAPTVEQVRGEWIYWKEQCEYCMNRNTCLYPENQESMEALKQWEKENKFWGSLKLICDYYVLDKDKYYLDNQPECNAEG